MSSNRAELATVRARARALWPRLSRLDERGQGRGRGAGARARPAALLFLLHYLYRMLIFHHRREADHQSTIATITAIATIAAIAITTATTTAIATIVAISLDHDSFSQCVHPSVRACTKIRPIASPAHAPRSRGRMTQLDCGLVTACLCRTTAALPLLAFT